MSQNGLMGRVTVAGNGTTRDLSPEGLITARHGRAWPDPEYPRRCPGFFWVRGAFHTLSLRLTTRCSRDGDISPPSFQRGCRSGRSNVGCGFASAFGGSKLSRCSLKAMNSGVVVAAPLRLGKMSEISFSRAFSRTATGGNELNTVDAGLPEMPLAGHTVRMKLMKEFVSYPAL